MSYEHELTDDEKVELLRIARATLREFARCGLIPPGKPHRQVLCEPAQVLVTIRRGDAIRGLANCDGWPLFQAVQRAAVDAATTDLRFGPVGAEELASLVIEIAVLGPAYTGDTAPHAEVTAVRIANGEHLGIGVAPPARVARLDELAQRASIRAGFEANNWRRDDVNCEVLIAQVFDEHTHPVPVRRA